MGANKTPGLLSGHKTPLIPVKFTDIIYLFSDTSANLKKYKKHSVCSLYCMQTSTTTSLENCDSNFYWSKRLNLA